MKQLIISLADNGGRQVSKELLHFVSDRLLIEVI